MEQKMRHSKRSQVFAALLLALMLSPGAALAQTPPGGPEAATKSADAAPEKPPAATQSESPTPPAGDSSAHDNPTKATTGPAQSQATPPPKQPSQPLAQPAPEAPAAAESRETQPASLPEAPAAVPAYPVRVESPIQGLELQLHRIQLGDIDHSPTEDYEAFVDACASPCETSIEAGAYQLAVRTPTGERARANTGLLLQGPATVTADVLSNAQIRREGWYWALIGSTVGAIAAGVGLAQNCDDNSCAKQASLGIWGGISVISVSWLIGIPKILTEDEVKITIAPGTTGTATRNSARHLRLAGAF